MKNMQLVANISPTVTKKIPICLAIIIRPSQQNLLRPG